SDDIGAGPRPHHYPLNPPRPFVSGVAHGCAPTGCRPPQYDRDWESAQKGPPPFVGNRTAAWALQKKTWGRPAMPTAAYFRRQADICLRLSLISSDEEVSNRLIIMAREYAGRPTCWQRKRPQIRRSRPSGPHCRTLEKTTGRGAGRGSPPSRPPSARKMGPEPPHSLKREARRVWRGGLEPIDAEAGANRADQPSASVVSSASARCRSRG